MNKLLLAVLATTSFASTGCIGLIGMAVGAHQETKEANQAETKSFQQLNTKFAALEKKEMPTDMDDLEKLYDKWNSLYSGIDSYRENGYFASKDIGSCIKNADRAKSDHCKQALALRGKVAGKIADVLHAAIDADPIMTSAFPVNRIIVSQAYPEIAAAVDVEASLTKLMPKWNEFYAKRLRKAGGAENLARKENHGICLFSDSEQGGAEVRFAFNRSSEQLYMHCVAPQPISSYDRTQQDSVFVSLETTSYNLPVATMPGNSSSAAQAYDTEISMSALRKKAMASAGGDDDSDRDDADSDDADAETAGAGKPKPWRFVLANVSYLTYQKTGEHTRESGDRIVVEDDIQENSLAYGLAVIDLEKDLFKQEVAVSDASDDDAADEEAAAPKPKKHKSSKKHGKHHKHKKS